MPDRPVKHVLVVDDHVFICTTVREAFADYNDDPDGAFQFKVDTETSIIDAIDRVRARSGAEQYDVIVLDLSFDPADNSDRSGLRIADALGLCRRLGQTIPVEIVFSGYVDVRACVQVMRHGAWDVIDKQDSPSGDPFRQIVASAVLRLKALHHQQALNRIAVRWLQEHLTVLQARYAGQVVALWNEPEMQVVASGRDAFELETRLNAWREAHPDWMYPFVVQIPEMTGIHAAQGV